jgi:glycosyltransferase involved in cell wall biosynthesis
MNIKSQSKINQTSKKDSIAIFHDYFGSIGGGEKLILDLAHKLNATIYTTELNQNNLKKINKNNVKIILLKQSIQIPIIKQIHTSIIFYNAKIPKYNQYIMSGNWAIFACQKHHPNIHYVYTPPRMFYDSKDYFYSIAPLYAKIPFLLWVAIHKYFYEKQLKYVGKFIADSKNVNIRIKKYFNKKSQIAYPPIRPYKFIKYGDFWLCVSRIYPHKRIELIIEAFKKMPKEKLILVGGYMKGDHAKSYAEQVLKKLPKNVEYIREVSEEKLEKLYGECKGFITMSKDEDFGMTVLEANSAGKAVIASNEGGHKETVITGKTGYLIKPDSKEIIKTIKKVSKDPSKFKTDSIINAKKFSLDEFVKKIVRELKAQKNHKEVS